MPEFTQDWFSHNLPGLESVMKMLPKRRRFLEVGAFEGRSTLWFYDQMEPGTCRQIDVIDTWGGSEEHFGIDFNEVKRRFDENTSKISKLVYEGTLFEFVCEGHVDDPYDFIYIDGSHQAADVLADACMAWPMLKKRGIMVFDDYLWGFNEDPIHTPKMAVDAFMACYRQRLEVVLIGQQWGVRKL